MKYEQEIPAWLAEELLKDIQEKKNQERQRLYVSIHYPAQENRKDQREDTSYEEGSIAIPLF